MLFVSLHSLLNIPTEVVTTNILASRLLSREIHQLVERLVSLLLEEPEGFAEEREPRSAEKKTRRTCFLSSDVIAVMMQYNYLYRVVTFSVCLCLPRACAFKIVGSATSTGCTSSIQCQPSLAESR